MSAGVGPAFPAEEYAGRLQKTRVAMEAAGVEVLVVADPANMNWLTGYDGWSFYVHQAVIVTLDHEPRWWGRPMDAVGARMTTRLAEDSIHAYPDDHVQNPERHAYEHLCDVLEGLGLAGRRFGVEMDGYYYTAACHATLAARLPNASFRDATTLVGWQRAVKSAAELDHMRRAARVVEAMHGRVREVAEPGLRKCDLVAEIYDAALRAGGDYAAIVPLVPSGREAAAAHLTWDERPLRHGEGTFVEIAGCHRRYHCPMSRSFFLGTPPDDMRRAETAVLEGLEAGIAVARPGNRCADVAGALFAALRRHGVEKAGRTGYSVGLAYPPDWGEHTMSLREGDGSVLREDMVFHFMPAIWTEEWGYETTETIRIRADGPAECLADVSRELFVKP